MNLLPIQIKQGMAPWQLQRAAQLYFEAFRRQITPILGADARAVDFLRQCLNPDYSLTALHEEQVVGLAGLQYGGQQFLSLRLPTFTRQFGWMLGRMRFRQATLFNLPQETDQLRIDSLIVDPLMRGAGVGTQLLNAAVEFAHRRGFNSVKIDVPDSVPGFQRLCQQMGFIVTATRVQQFLKPFGLTAFTTLTKTV